MSCNSSNIKNKEEDRFFYFKLYDFSKKERSELTNPLLFLSFLVLFFELNNHFKVYVFFSIIKKICWSMHFFNVKKCICKLKWNHHIFISTNLYMSYFLLFDKIFVFNIS